MTALSMRLEKELLDELDRLANLEDTDRTTITRKILKRGIHLERLDLAILLYIKGETLERAANLSECDLWDLLEELPKRGITKRFDPDGLRELAIKVLAKDNETLKRQIINLPSS